MARPPRLNADYFSHDANASIDDRIVFLESRFGLIGYALYFKLLETLTNAEYFEIDWNDTRCAILAKKYGVEATTLQDFVVASTIPEIRAFTTSNGKLYSEDLKSRMSLLVEKARRADESEHRKLYSRWERINVREWNRMRKMIFKRDNYTCAYCGQIGGRLEVDHIAPLSKGGTNTDDNLTTSCRRCNRQKRDKTVEQFLLWKGNRK